MIKLQSVNREARWQSSLLCCLSRRLHWEAPRGGRRECNVCCTNVARPSQWLFVFEHVFAAIVLNTGSLFVYPILYNVLEIRKLQSKLYHINWLICYVMLCYLVPNVRCKLTSLSCLLLHCCCCRWPGNNFYRTHRFYATSISLSRHFYTTSADVSLTFRREAQLLLLHKPVVRKCR